MGTTKSRQVIRDQLVPLWERVADLVEREIAGPETVMVRYLLEALTGMECVIKAERFQRLKREQGVTDY